MDELDLFRGFRSGAAAPSADAEQRAFTRLTQAIDGPPGRGGRVLRLIRQRPGRATLALAVLAGAVATALFASTPWKSSPGFLERAQAALSPPEGSVLHMRWNETHISEELGCTVELPTQELWIDQEPPHRFRLLGWSLPGIPKGADPRTRACRHKGEIVEFGRTLDTLEAVLMFVPPNILTPATGTDLRPLPDPVGSLRQAIASGHARAEGEAVVDGRRVERIRIDPLCGYPRCPDRPDYAYVDSDTFSFVRDESPSGFTFTPGPGFETFQFDVVVDYLTFEYLPRTAANLALTDIRAQHPDATGP
jgi:hypothetical protein